MTARLYAGAGSGVKLRFLCVAIARQRGEKHGMDSHGAKRSAAAWVCGAILCLPLQGCTLAACGLGVATMANDSVARHHEQYASYVRRAQAENAERSAAGLPEREILSRRAWSGQSREP